MQRRTAKPSQSQDRECLKFGGFCETSRLPTRAWGYQEEPARLASLLLYEIKDLHPPHTPPSLATVAAIAIVRVTVCWTLLVLSSSFRAHLSARPGERIARALQRPDCPRAPARNLSTRLSGASIRESRPAPPQRSRSCCVTALNLSLLHHYFILIISCYSCITHLLLQHNYISISITAPLLQHHYYLITTSLITIRYHYNIISTWLLHDYYIITTWLPHH